MGDSYQRGGCTGKGFLPGRSGNPGGRPKGSLSLTAVLREAVAAGDGERARRIADTLVGLAEEGDVKAAQAIFDRLEGRPRQPLEVAATAAHGLTPEDVEALIWFVGSGSLEEGKEAIEAAKTAGGGRLTCTELMHTLAERHRQERSERARRVGGQEALPEPE